MGKSMFRKKIPCVRVFAFFLIIAFLFSSISFTAYAEETVVFNDSAVLTDTLLLVNADSGKVLYSKNSDVKKPIASVTKIMTCILALENFAEPNSHTIEIKEQPVMDVTNIGASMSGFQNHIGESYSALDILYGLMLPSGCEAAQIIAYEVGGKPTDFAKMMNDKAKDIGCQDTYFAEAHGVSDENYSTAEDLVKLTDYAMDNPLFKKIVATEYYQIDGFAAPIYNTNSLICEENNRGLYYKYVTGVKTGTTDKAGKCIISTAQKGEDGFICIALGGVYSADDGYVNHAMTDTISLYDWAFKNFTKNINVDIEKSYASVRVGSDISVEATLTNLPIGESSVIEWSSSDESIASVDSNGVIHGKKLGQAKITAKTATGNFDTIAVSVGFYNGIDVTSRYGDYTTGTKQPLNWGAVKESGFDFAVIRAGWGSEDYPNQNDAEFVNNVKGATENNILFYLSFVAYAQSKEEAVAEAEYFLREMEEYFPKDCEDGLISVVYNMTYSKFSENDEALNTDVAIAFAEKIKEKGYDTLINTNKKIFSKLNTDKLKENKVGIYYNYYPYIIDLSQYIELPNGTIPDMWQFRSDGYFPQASDKLNSNLCIAYMQDYCAEIDVNKDGKVNVNDVTYIQKVLAQIIETPENFGAYGDVNNDSKVNIWDATYIQRYLVGLK